MRDATRWIIIILWYNIIILYYTNAVRNILYYYNTSSSMMYHVYISYIFHFINIILIFIILTWIYSFVIFYFTALHYRIGQPVVQYSLFLMLLMLLTPYTVSQTALRKRRITHAAAGHPTLPVRSQQILYLYKLV